MAPDRGKKWDAVRRIDQSERMDDRGVGPEMMAGALADLRRVNTLFGGLGPTLRCLWPMIRRAAAAGGPDHPIRILDVAAGDGFLLRKLVDQARREGISLRATALDIHPVVAGLAARACASYPEISVLQGDALALPFSSGAFHFAMSSLALHHLGLENAARAVREMRRIASCGFVVNDLRRSRTAYAITRAALWLLRCNPITRHDGPVSIRRAFTRREYQAILRLSGVPDVHYREHLWFRAVLWWDAYPQLGQSRRNSDR